MKYNFSTGEFMLRADDMQQEAAYEPEADAVYRERLKPHAPNRFAAQRIEVMSGADLDAIGHLYGIRRR